MPNCAPHTVLFVDDQPEVTEALELAFHKRPFSVRTANSAAQALNILSNSAVDVVISDEQMPVMTGSQFLAIVRREYPSVIRIILSADSVNLLFGFSATILVPSPPWMTNCNSI
jgi:DNA-binding NtrC family response regulator